MHWTIVCTKAGRQHITSAVVLLVHMHDAEIDKVVIKVGLQKLQ